VTSGDFHDDGQHPSPPWYNRTSAVLGASVLAVVVVGILVLAISYMSRQFSEPVEAPLNFVEPTFSATSPGTGTSTTTQTITSTSPPQTTEIGGPLDPSTTPSTTSSTTSSSETTSESPTLEDEAEDEESTERTTRRPRTNVTRTLNPFP
jgi:hypothetical protein